MGCGTSRQLGDNVKLAPAKKAVTQGDDCLRFGEVGKIIEVTVAGPLRVKGPRGKLRWYPQPAVALAAPAGLHGVALWKWWMSRWKFKAEKAAKLETFDAFHEDVDARRALEDELLLSQSPAKVLRQATHWDLLAPLVATTALHHMNASSPSLGGGWVGAQEGACLLLQLAHLGDFAAGTMARFGDAGEDRLNTLLAGLFTKLVEVVRAHGGEVIHINRDRLLCCFCDGEPRPPTMERRGGGEHTARVSVVVLEASGLVKKDLFGQNDPYVKVRLGEEERQTPSLNGGGENPVWGEGAGTKLYFDLKKNSPPVAVVQVYDEDVGPNPDDLIGGGSASFALGMPNARGEIPSAIADAEGWQAKGGGWEREVWVQLRDKRQDPTGQLRLRMVIDPPVGAAVLQTTKAVQCAAALLAGEAAKPAAAMQVGLHVGIGAGRMQWVHCDAKMDIGVADKLHRRAAVVRGPAVAQAMEALGTAANGQCMLSHPAAQAVSRVSCARRDAIDAVVLHIGSREKIKL